jgi:putative ABC transport system permease protein
MLLGHPRRYLTMVFGIALASLLIAQQVSIFCGVLRMTSGQIRDVEDAQIWVVTPGFRYIDDLESLPDRRLAQVRSVSGVAWAVPLYKGMCRAYLQEGRFHQLLLVGLDDATLAGAPRTMLAGSATDLQQPDAVLVDEVGEQLLWPGQPTRLGRELTINDRRARVVGICRTELTFQTLPLVYARASLALTFLPPQRRAISALLVRCQKDADVSGVCDRIRNETGLLAVTPQELARRTVDHYLEHTGLLANFGTTVLLGFIVGIAIAGQTFYNFLNESRAYFGTLKAMGLTNARLVGMILQQAALVAGVGYGLGVGLAALFGEVTRGHSKLVFFMPWWVLVGTGLAILAILLLSAGLGIVRVLRTEPAMIVRGLA